MEDALSTWLNDPIVAKLAAATIGILVVFVVVRLLNRGLSRLIQESRRQRTAVRCANT